MQNKNSVPSEIPQNGDAESLFRPRLNELLAQGIKNPLTIVCAGMGYGKTQALHDFARTCGLPSVWIQFSESDNNSSHFWDNFVRSVAKTNKYLSQEYRKIGFPDTGDKMSMYYEIRNKELEKSWCIFVFDDFHLIKNTAVLGFMERAINSFPENRSLILVSRDLPQINISGLMIRNKAFIINESDLNFTETELSQFLINQGLSAELKNLQMILHDTNGWAFIIGFVARILKKTPGYMGYARNAIKKDVLELLEMEAWNVMSDKLKRLLLKLSLTDHRAVELVEILAENDEEIITELRSQNAFVRFDRYIDSYYIHQLFIKFLRKKQNLLTDEEKRESCRIFADWGVKNDFIVDALFNYEKIGDYDSIIATLLRFSIDYQKTIAEYVTGIFDNAPEEVYDNIDLSAAMHVHLVLCSGRIGDALDLLKFYESKYLKLPEGNDFKNRMLSCLYYFWGVIRISMSTQDDNYDFDKYFARQYKYSKNTSIDFGCRYQHPASLWAGLSGTSRKGAPQEFQSALSKSLAYMQKCVPGLAMGLDILCRGELSFYRGDLDEAEKSIAGALELSLQYRQYEISLRALLYIMRISVAQGDYKKFEQMKKEIDGLLINNEDSIRFLTSDIASGLYYYFLGKPERIADWLKEKFTDRVYNNTLENFGNYIKTKYFYITENYDVLLDYIGDMKNKKIVLYKKIESLAMEACVLYKMNDKEKALDVLRDAYGSASPNGIKMPFIELGKDMRALAGYAISIQYKGIENEWLVGIKKSASAYSRNLAQIVFEYKRANEPDRKIVLSPRESSTLNDLYNGLSRSDIASKYGLSVNTVKLHINSIYDKLGARNRADVFRIAAENGLLL